MSRHSQLVCQQLENIDRVALEKYQHLIRKYIRHRNGVYALYRGDKLYYVGLAKNLRSRLKSHLRDRHRQSWDRFSVYLTIGTTFIKEMESLLLRITQPPGNKVRGKFQKCQNLERKLHLIIAVRIYLDNKTHIAPLPFALRPVGASIYH